MPYISKGLRKKLDTFAMGKRCSTPGDLNYMITRLCLGYIQKVPKNYTTFNEVVGAIECAKLEFARRIMYPYEDTKIKLNGDVYCGEEI